LRGVYFIEVPVGCDIVLYFCKMLLLVRAGKAEYRGCFHFTSYNCMRIYNYVKIKSIILKGYRKWELLFSMDLEFQVYQMKVSWRYVNSNMNILYRLCT
jgi:hypothetical protein